MLNRILAYLIMPFYGIMMSGPFAVGGTIGGLLVGMLIGWWLHDYLPWW